MKQTILIPTHEGHEEWLHNCIHSIRVATQDKLKYALTIVGNGSDVPAVDVPWDWELTTLKNPENWFEYGAVIPVMERTKYDEVFLLHDTCEIKNAYLFDLIFEKYPGISVALTRNFQMHMGKFLRSVLEKVDIPRAKDAWVDADVEESFPPKYIVAADWRYVTLFPGFASVGDWPPEREEKFGRLNMVLENEFLKKYKSKWSRNMIRT